MRHGKGLLKDDKEKLSYDGYFKNNIKDGFGVEQKGAPGYFKEGQWKNDKLNGEGRMIVYDQSGDPLMEMKGNFLDN